MTDFLSPIGRMVQGGITLEQKKDDNGKPKFKEDGSKDLQCFIALAVPKSSPDALDLYNLMYAEAQSAFPHLVNANGEITHPQFAWKFQDGDGVDASGQSVAEKPGFAGHWIYKFATSFLPTCYHEGKWAPHEAIQNPEEVIKRGYWIQVYGKVEGNGVAANERTKKPGLYLTPQLVTFIGRGDLIVGGPDATKAFANAGQAHRPQGIDTTMNGGPRPAPQPGGAPRPAPAGAGGAPAPRPAPAGAAPAPRPTPAAAGPRAPGAAPRPPVKQGPRYVMTETANGCTREQLHAEGWDDESLIEHGHMYVEA